MQFVGPEFGSLSLPRIRAAIQVRQRNPLAEAQARDTLTHLAQTLTIYLTGDRHLPENNSMVAPYCST